ncbi:MAG: type II toxin-antitoxin system PemK/MazF family toxin [Candidatus Saccharimonas sp.]|nr:type II toxin-antitoxin system PemK/MazF family toxin [Planctomycetaceae bacterium]
MNRGDVVLVDYPFSDGSGSKVRPALIVLADSYNRKLSHTIVAMISSSSSRIVGDASQLVLELGSPELQQSGLWLRSVVMCENLTPVRQSRVLKTLGKLPTSAVAKIEGCLKSAFEIG